MFGLRVTINEEPSVVAAAEDAHQVIAMLTATGVLGRSTRPQRVGEALECWLSVRASRQVAGRTERVEWMRRNLCVGDRVAIEIVAADQSSTPQVAREDEQTQAGPATRMFGFVVRVDDEPPVTAAADDLGVLTAVVGAAGALGRLASPSRREQAQDYRLSLSGLTSRGDGTGDEHLDWLHREDLAVGDRVTIEIVDTAHASIPAGRAPPR